MKRFIICLVAAVLAVGALNAQAVDVRFGVQGGLTLGKTVAQSMDLKLGSLPGWHAGATLELKMPFFFSLQPSVNFEQSRSRLTGLYAQDFSSMKLNAINVPVALQWGPDLGLLRFYAQVVPYWDFVLNGGCSMTDGSDMDIRHYLNPAQFGLGLGGGIELWHLQLSMRYNWGLGQWNNMKEGSPFNDMDSRRRGLTLTLAYMFF